MPLPMLEASGEAAARKVVKCCAINITRSKAWPTAVLNRRGQRAARLRSGILEGSRRIAVTARAAIILPGENTGGSRSSPLRHQHHERECLHRFFRRIHPHFRHAAGSLL